MKASTNITEQVSLNIAAATKRCLCLLPPKANREADRKRLHIVPPAWRNKQHLPWLQHTLRRCQVCKRRMSTQIWVINVNLTRVLGQAGLIRIEATSVPRVVQTHILGTHNLCKKVVVWVMVQWRHLHAVKYLRCILWCMCCSCQLTDVNHLSLYCSATINTNSCLTFPTLAMTGSEAWPQLIKLT